MTQYIYICIHCIVYIRAFWFEIVIVFACIYCAPFQEMLLFFVRHVPHALTTFSSRNTMLFGQQLLYKIRCCIHKRVLVWNGRSLLFKCYNCLFLHVMFKVSLRAILGSFEGYCTGVSLQHRWTMPNSSYIIFGILPQLVILRIVPVTLLECIYIFNATDLICFCKTFYNYIILYLHLLYLWYEFMSSCAAKNVAFHSPSQVLLRLRYLAGLLNADCPCNSTMAVVKPLINVPLGDGLCNLFMMTWGRLIVGLTTFLRILLSISRFLWKPWSVYGWFIPIPIQTEILHRKRLKMLNYRMVIFNVQGVQGQCWQLSCKSSPKMACSDSNDVILSRNLLSEPGWVKHSETFMVSPTLSCISDQGTPKVGSGWFTLFVHLKIKTW